MLKEAEPEVAPVAATAASAISPLSDKENKEATATTSAAAENEGDELDFGKKKKKKESKVQFDDDQNEVIEVCALNSAKKNRSCLNFKPRFFCLFKVSRARFGPEREKRRAKAADRERRCERMAGQRT